MLKAIHATFAEEERLLFNLQIHKGVRNVSAEALQPNVLQQHYIDLLFPGIC